MNLCYVIISPIKGPLMSWKHVFYLIQKWKESFWLGNWLNNFDIFNYIIWKFKFHSSVASIYGSTAVSGQNFTENDWAPVDGATAYPKSKILAEKAAWDFVKQRKERNQLCFELAVINPGYVMGPLLHDCECTSIEAIKKLLEKQIPLLPDLHFATCGM